MKSGLFILILTVFVYILSAQNPIEYNIVNYYNGDSSQNDAVIRGIAKLDTNYIIVTVGEYNNKYYGTQVLKVDKYGIMLDVYRFNEDSIRYPTYVGNCIVIDSDTNIIIGTNTQNVHAAYINIWEGYLIKLDKNLDTIWTKSLHLPDSLVGGCNRPNNHFTAIDITHDGGYIVMGNYYYNCSYTVQDWHPYLSKYNKNGDLLWVKTYNNLGPAFDIATTSDSGFVFTSTINSVWGVCVIKVDSLGNFEWHSQSNSFTHLRSFDLTVSQDNIISVIPYSYFGNSSDPYSVLYGLDITKINSLTGQITWNKQYIPMITVKCPTLHQHIEVEVDENENIIIAATGLVWNSDSTASAYKGFIMKLNSNGDSLWSHFYDWGNTFQRYAQFNDFVIADDGGILAGGYWNPPYLNYKQGAWLVKVDSMGNAPGMFTVGIEENELIINNVELKIYPNPTADNINLSMVEQPKHDLQLEVYTISGQLVLEKQLPAFEKKHRIYIQDLQSGVYLVKLMSENQVVYSSKIIKE